MNSRFSFVGEIDANSLESKVPFYREIKKSDKNGNIITDGIGLNLVVIAATNNRAFCEMVGFKNDKIKTYDSDGNELNIDWDDRFDENVTKDVANYKKYVITLNGDRHEFVSSYDFIKFVIDHIEEIKHKRFTVTGQISKNVYKGKISDRFQIQNLFEVKEDEEKKNQLRVMSEFFYNADSIDTADWKKEKKLRLAGFTKEYIDSDHKNVYVSRDLVFDCSKVDWDNKLHTDRVAYKLEQLKLSLDGDKIVSGLKKNRYYSIATILSYKNGAEEVEFDESSLTPNQKRAIELNLKKLEDFRPKGSIYGERVIEFKLIDFDLRDPYENGAVAMEESSSDFEENIFTPIVEETVADLEKSMNKPEESTELDSDDLFD